MRAVFTILFCLTIYSQAVAGPTSQLYTGDAITVPPGQFQLQGCYDSSFGGPQRVGGASLTYGAAKSTDVKLGYGHLWNDIGPDVQLGPNLGVKWRFIGDGKRQPSVALSGLCAFNKGIAGTADKNDYGALLIIQYPIKPVILLANFGHVFIGNPEADDLRYISFAAAKFVSPRTLMALEYSDLQRLGKNPKRISNQIAAALVYVPNPKLSYTAQLGYRPNARDVKLHLTFGVSAYL